MKIRRLNINEDLIRHFDDDDDYSKFGLKTSKKLLYKLSIVKKGDTVKCITKFPSDSLNDKFKVNDNYLVIDVIIGYIYIRYENKFNKLVKFKMTNNTFKTHFSVVEETIKTDDIIPNDSLFDEDWDELDSVDHIYTVATGRDYDIHGYVIATDDESAKLKSISDGICPSHLKNYLRVDELDPKRYNITLSRSKMEAGRTYLIYNTLQNSINDIKKNKII